VKTPVTCVPSDETREGSGSCYPSIADDALIGDAQKAGLVAADGAINWFCRSRFGWPMYAALLDDRLDPLKGLAVPSERAARHG